MCALEPRPFDGIDHGLFSDGKAVVVLFLVPLEEPAILPVRIWATGEPDLVKFRLVDDDTIGIVVLPEFFHEVAGRIAFDPDFYFHKPPLFSSTLYKGLNPKLRIV